MKVLQISKYYYPFIGGTEQVARDIADVLKEAGVEQKIICFNEDSSDKNTTYKHNETITDTVDGVEIIRCGYSKKIASQSLSASYPKKLKEVLNDFAPDVVILHYPNPFVTAFLLNMLKKDVKLAVYWHLDITKQKVLGKLFHGQNIKLLKRADKIIATSPNYIDGSPYLSKFRDKCTVIPNCIRTERLEPTALSDKKADEIRSANPGKTLVFACGRHVPYKGMTYLVKASKYLDDDFGIFIGGKGELTEELKKEAEGDSKITFLGRVSDDDLKGYYTACDIFAFPSITKNEAFGIALAEAMYMELPAVTFEIPGSGVNYVSINGETGIECANRDAEAFAKALKTLRDDKELAAAYARGAKKRVAENFMYSQFKENIKYLIKCFE